MDYYENAQKALTALLQKKPYLSDNKNSAYEKGVLAAKSVTKEIHESGGGQIEILNRLHGKLREKPFNLTHPKYVDAYRAGLQAAIECLKSFA